MFALGAEREDPVEEADEPATEEEIRAREADVRGSGGGGLAG